MNRRQQEDTVRKAKRVADAFTELHRQLPTILARNAESAGRDGYSAGKGGPGRTFDPRPTEAVALALEEHGELPDPFDALVVSLLGQLDRAGIEGAAVMLTLGKLSRLSLTPTTGPMVCANQFCPDGPAVITFVGNDRPRRGRCRKCYGYLQAHDRDRRGEKAS
jgi:hypothetical protein